MVKLVFARHGESEWNKANLFTGWADVDLSEKGTQQAIDAGKLIKEAGIEFDQAYTSVLKRAIKTTNLALEASDQLWVPVEKSWRLNERHYGGLTGKNKAEAAEQFGDEHASIPVDAVRPLGIVIIKSASSTAIVTIQFVSTIHILE